MRLSSLPPETTGLTTADPFERPDIITAAQQPIGGLDAELEVRLSEFRKSGLPWIILPSRFVVTSSAEATPKAMRERAGKTAEVALRALLVWMKKIGLEPVSFLQENEGAIAVHLTPLPSTASDQRSYEKSIKALRGHTDGSFNPSVAEFLGGDNEFSSAPDVVALACIRNPNSVATRLARLSDVMAKLTSADIGHLMQPKFLLAPQPSFHFEGSPTRVGPVIWQDEAGVHCCRFSHSYLAIDGEADPNGEAALRHFVEALEECFQDVALEPGEILLFNNRTLVHGRGEIGEEWSEGARWLIRAYGRLKTTPIVQADPHRPWIAR